MQITLPSVFQEKISTNKLLITNNDIAYDLKKSLERKYTNILINTTRKIEVVNIQ